MNKSVFHLTLLAVVVCSSVLAADSPTLIESCQVVMEEGMKALKDVKSDMPSCMADRLDAIGLFNAKSLDGKTIGKMLQEAFLIARDMSEDEAKECGKETLDRVGSSLDDAYYEVDINDREDCGEGMAEIIELIIKRLGVVF